MDVRLAVASKRDHRAFDPGPIDSATIEQILDAGRLAGSARNRQPWRFLVATTAGARGHLATLVYVPQLVTSAPLAIGVAVTTSGSAVSGFDAGRAAQNMMLAGWELGVASCPNGIVDPDVASATLGLAEDQQLVTVLAFGRPAHPRDPSRRSADEWSRRAHRYPLNTLVRQIADPG